MTSNFKIYIAVDSWYYITPLDKSHELFIKSIKESSEKIPFIKIGAISYSPKMYFVEDYNTKSGREYTNSDALVVEVDIPHYYTDFNYTSISALSHVPSGDPNDLDGIYWWFRHELSLLLFRQTYYFLCLTQISFPGSYGAHAFELYINDDFLFETGTFKNFIAGKLIKQPWPVFINLSLTEVWNWTIANDIDFNLVSKTKASRALFALTYLFTEPNSNINHNIFWAMYGIEALFCSGKKDKVYQIDNNSQIILGSNSRLQYRIQKLYDYRSRFVHGQLNIPSPYYYDDDRNITKETFGLTHSINAVFAIQILIASLQRLIKSGKPGFNFQKRTNSKL